MAIYTSEEMKCNQLYRELMQGINNLHDRMGAPVELADGAEQVTTGYEVANQWDVDAIGDWDGAEQEIADIANEWAEQVLRGIGQGYHHYNQSQDWIEFEASAVELWHEDKDQSFDRLCNMCDLCA